MDMFFLDKVYLKDYRCFTNTCLHFKELCILVGKNNAGKSTVIEALRLIAVAGKKSNKAVFDVAPVNMGFSAYDKGIKIDTIKLKIDLRSIVNFYKDGIASISAIFKDKTKIEIRLSANLAFACLYNENGKNIRTRSVASRYHFNSISILPQIGLIKENEKMLAYETIKSDEENYLSSRHFRNEIWQNKKDKFRDFKEIAMDTWDGLLIKDDSLVFDITTSEYLQLYVQDSGFPAEIGLMGSGIQMWLQIIWFLCKSKDSLTVILDEPDVYMHPDLQIKLLRLVKNRFYQVIIATHSVEIISDVDVNNIVLIDKEKKNISYANESLAVQNIIDSIGGVQNLALMRLGSAKKCLFVEGNDSEYLSLFEKQLNPKSVFSIKDLPCITLNGKANLVQAYGAAELLYQESKDSIKCLCILDGDYQSEESKITLIKQAADKHLCLHIWKRKEIENYILEPHVLYRIIQKRNQGLSYDAFLQEFSNVIDSCYDSVFDLVSTQFKIESGKLEIKTCNELAREYLREQWEGLEGKISLVKGKNVLPKIIEMMKNKYSTKTSVNKIISEFTKDDMDAELVTVLNTLTTQ